MSRKLITRHSSTFLLLLLIIIGAILRLYNLENVPVGFHADEAYFGYNAYSLFNTGKDITGHVLPLHLESFLYSPAGYAYLIIPFIAFFDLTPLAVRLPGALFGIATLPLLYFLVKKLFADAPSNKWIALAATLLFTISPWHINLSRVSAENVVVTFLLCLGVLLYLYWVTSQKTLYVLLAFIAFSSTYLFYQAPRAFLPLFLISLVLLTLKQIPGRKYTVVGTSYLLLIVLPVLFILSSHTLSYRIKMLSIFEFPKTQALIEEAIVEDGLSRQPALIARIFHNKPAGYATEVFDTYMKHFSYEFLFTDQGLPARYKVHNVGLLYLFELPLLLAGVYTIVRRRSKAGIICISWILLGVVGSALTYDDVPNLQRTLLILPALQTISGLGAVVLLRKLNKKVFPVALFISLFVVVLFVSYYLHQYYVHQLIHKPIYRQEGYKELVGTVNKRLPEYKYASITTRYASPLIMFMFYTRYDPATFQKEINEHPHNYLTEDFSKNNLNKYHFFTDECSDKEKLEKRVLYVDLGSCEVPQQTVNVLDEIKRGDGGTVFRVLEKRTN